MNRLHPLLGPALLLALLTLLSLPLRPLTPIDETRYISVAWEMWLRDEYLVMFKNGEPYSHKPPLLFWLYNLGWAITGVNEWWPRLVSPLFSFGCLGLTLSISRRLWPASPEIGQNALWILASSLLWMLFSTSGMFDVMLAFFALLGIRGLLVATQDSLPRGFAWLALAIGGGVLAKGPVILLHLLPVALLAPWWNPGQTSKRWGGSILLGVLGGAAIALAWAIPAAIHGGEEYQRMIFWGQTANRMVDSFAHKRALWWYLPLLPLLLFPWMVWPRLWREWSRLSREDWGLKLCLTWLVPVFLFFSLISGKQVHYLIPLFPAFALIAGRLTANSSRGGLWLPVMLTLAIAGGMLYLSQLPVLPGTLKSWAPLPWWPGALLLMLAIVAWWLGKNRPHRQILVLVGLGASTFLVAQMLLSANLWHRYDVRPIAAEIRKLQDQGIPVANEGEYHAQFHFAGRLQKRIEPLEGIPSIAAWFRAHPEGRLIYYRIRPDRGPSSFRQPYQEENALLIDREQAHAWRLLK
jgi:4-amino-4-deoxy-L-arabinose transferase-like glycosyltransferase